MNMIAGVSASLFFLIALMLFLLIFKKRIQAHSGAKPATDSAHKLSQAEVDKLMTFLEEADDAYIKAYQYRSLGELIRYTSRELAIEMQQKITYYNDKIWGTPAHRQRTWSIVSTDDSVITVRKELTFKKVRYGRMHVKLGDDCVEYWKIGYDNLDKRYKVQDIA